MKKTKLKLILNSNSYRIYTDNGIEYCRFKKKYYPLTEIENVINSYKAAAVFIRGVNTKRRRGGGGGLMNSEEKRIFDDEVKKRDALMNARLKEIENKKVAAKRAEEEAAARKREAATAAKKREEEEEVAKKREEEAAAEAAVAAKREEEAAAAVEKKEATANEVSKVSDKKKVSNGKEDLELLLNINSKEENINLLNENLLHFSNAYNLNRLQELIRTNLTTDTPRNINGINKKISDFNKFFDKTVIKEEFIKIIIEGIKGNTIVSYQNIIIKKIIQISIEVNGTQKTMLNHFKDIMDHSGQGKSAEMILEDIINNAFNKTIKQVKVKGDMKKEKPANEAATATKKREEEAAARKRDEEAARARAEAEAREAAKREEERVEREAQEKQKREEKAAARARAEAEAGGGATLEEARLEREAQEEQKRQQEAAARARVEAEAGRKATLEEKRIEEEAAAKKREEEEAAAEAAAAKRTITQNEIKTPEILSPDINNIYLRYIFEKSTTDKNYLNENTIKELKEYENICDAVNRLMIYLTDTAKDIKDTNYTDETLCDEYNIYFKSLVFTPQILDAIESDTDTAKQTLTKSYIKALNKELPTLFANIKNKNKYKELLGIKGGDNNYKTAIDNIFNYTESSDESDMLYDSDISEESIISIRSDYSEDLITPLLASQT